MTKKPAPSEATADEGEGSNRPETKTAAPTREQRLAALKAELEAAAPDRFSSREALGRHKVALNAYEAALRA